MYIYITRKYITSRYNRSEAVGRGEIVGASGSKQNLKALGKAIPYRDTSPIRNHTPKDPTIGLCRVLYSGPRGGCCFV